MNYALDLWSLSPKLQKQARDFWNTPRTSETHSGILKHDPELLKHTLNFLNKFSISEALDFRNTLWKPDFSDKFQSFPENFTNTQLYSSFKFIFLIFLIGIYVI